MCTITSPPRPSYRIELAPRRKLVAVCTTPDCTWRSEPGDSGGIVGARFDRHNEEQHS